MPTYAYACKDCGHAFDIVQSFSDDSLTVCPECEGALRKKFNSVGVVFKGSGFYRNDARSDGSASKSSGATTAASSNGSTGSESSTGASSGSTGSADQKSDSSAPASSGSAAAKTPATASA